MEAPHSPLDPTSCESYSIENGESSPVMPISPPLECLSPSSFNSPPASVASSMSSPIEIQIPFPWCPKPTPKRCNSSAMLLVDQTKPRWQTISLILLFDKLLIDFISSIIIRMPFNCWVDSKLYDSISQHELIFTLEYFLNAHFHIDLKWNSLP